jgi:folylpolyglutamate synthase/dihydropteroate synthase
MIGKKVVVKDKISDAVEHAKKVANKQDLICVTGSLFTVGDAREHFQKH